MLSSDWSRFKQICVEESLPYCTIQKKRGSVVSIYFLFVTSSDELREYSEY